MKAAIVGGHALGGFADQELERLRSWNAQGTRGDGAGEKSSAGELSLDRPPLIPTRSILSAHAPENAKEV